MGTLLATALMRAGKVAKGKSELTTEERSGGCFTLPMWAFKSGGKAKPGDKTIIDALHPAAAAFSEAVQRGESLQEAGEKMVTAARAGLESVTPKRSKIGRAGWVGERTEGKVDPGCAARAGDSFRSRCRREEMTIKKIAYLGLGIMGQGMVGNLLKAGYDVTVWNRSEDKTEDAG